MYKKRVSGFTLVEVVVVMAIIAILAVVIIGAISIVRKRAQYTQAENTMRDIKTAFQAYTGKTGHQPPSGDSYSFWSGPYDGSQASADSAWRGAVDAMVTKGVINQSIADKYYVDPWGSPYAYDNNYGQCIGVSHSFVSDFRTAGADKTLFTGDDSTSDIDHGDQGCLWTY